MSPFSTRRDTLRLCGVALGLGTAGCVQPATNESSSNEAVSTDSADSTTPAPTAVPPSVVSDEEATERALGAEKAYITERLEDASCLTGWGATPTTASKEATLTDRTAEGVHVEVMHPYWYSAQWQRGNETVVEEADGETNAVYVVTSEEVRREYGDTISVSC